MPSMIEDPRSVAPADAALDDIDRALLRALARDGRAAWSVLGTAAGCSASTAQRRVGRLTEVGALRMIAASDVLASGFGVSAMVRFRCGADRADALVTMLRTRPEVRFAATLTGSADCVAEVVVPSVADLTGFLAEVAIDGRPVESEALPIVRTFTAPFAVFPGDGADVVMPESSTTNAPAPDLRSGDGVEPVGAAATSEDRGVFAALVRDGRAPVTDIARSLGRAEAPTRRTLEDLLASGRVRIGPLVAPAALGFRSELMVWISVAPDTLAAAARQLAAHSSVHYTAASLGRFNLIGQAFLSDFAAVYTFVTEVLGALPGVREVDVTVQLRTAKRMWNRIDDGRFVPATDEGRPAIAR